MKPIRKIIIANPASSVKITKEGRVIMSLNVSFEAPRMPLSMAIMASGLESFAEVRIIDAVNLEMSRSQLRQEIAAFQPDLVIINCSTPTIEDDMAVIRDAKALGAATAIFGQHVDAIPEEVMAEYQALDFCFLQEPELVATDFVRAWRDGTDFSQLAGLGYRDARGCIKITAKYPYVSVESYPRPARHLLDLSLYRLPDGELYTALLASRGCPFDCPFCVAPPYHGLKVRRRDPASLVAEVAEIVNKYGITSFLFQSDLFTSKKQWVRDVCQKIIESGLKIRWICNSRVDTVDRETLEMMKRAGCFLIGIGIESGSPEMLPVLGKKKADTAQIKWKINTCHELGIKTNGSFVIGYPGETEQTLRETEELVMQLPLDFAVFMCATPFPGTHLYNYLMDPDTPYRLVKDWKKVGFHDYAIEGGLPAETIKNFNARMWRQYFFSRHYLKLRLGDLKQPVRLTKTVWYALKRLRLMRSAFR